MRTFLAKSGMLNNSLMALGLLEPLQAMSFLDWRGVVVTFVWKQLPFAALLISGAMASMDRSLIESARGLGAGRLRILLEIVLPQVAATVGVSLILSFVTMLSALSVPMMIIAGSPTMITVDMAWRVNSYGDYGVANALGFVSFAMSGIAAWFYLRQRRGRERERDRTCPAGIRRYQRAVRRPGMLRLRRPDRPARRRRLRALAQHADLDRHRGLVFPRQTADTLGLRLLEQGIPPARQAPCRRCRTSL